MAKYTAEWCAANPEEAAMVISNLQEAMYADADVDACNAAAQEAMDLDKLANEEIPVAPRTGFFQGWW